MVRLNTLLAALSLTATSLGLGSDTLKPDSRIARNVLEGKSEGYCSVSQLPIYLRPITDQPCSHLDL
jgi:hypothetical protein